jgi:DNA-binding transcriptional LysR family regulator
MAPKKSRPRRPAHGEALAPKLRAALNALDEALRKLERRATVTARKRARKPASPR